MSVPNFKSKYSKKPFFLPEELVKCQRKAGKFFKNKSPQGVIFCYEQELLEYILNHYKIKKINNPYGDMYLLEKNKVAVIGNFGLGAPTVAIIIEEFISIGIKKFISIGTAGSLQTNLKHGDLVVCDRAIRDEGTSYHYLKGSKYAYASDRMIKNIEQSLKKHNQEYNKGTSWTTDAMFRETVDEVKQYQKRGVATIDMEASALFAIARYRKIDVGVIFTISDCLVEHNWDPKFHSKDTH